MNLLTHILLRPRSLWDVVMAGGAVWMLHLVGHALRQTIAPIAEERLFVDLTTGALTFLIAGAIGGMLAYHLFEVCVCSFAAQLPGLSRAVRTVLFSGLGLCVLAAAVVGFAIQPDSADGCGLASLAAIGFGIATWISDPASSIPRRHGLLTLLALLSISIAAPEFMTLARWAPSSILVASAVVAASCVWVTGTRTRSRDRALTTSATLDLAYREQDMHSGAWARPIDAVRARADRFRGVRRSDLDWARAAWHEWKGNLQGGWIPTVLTQGVISCLCVLGFHWLATSADPGSGGSLVRFARDTNSTSWLVGPAFFAALWITMIELGTPALFVHGVHRPVSRARRARISWIASTAEDLLHFCALFLLLVTAALVLARYVVPSQAAPTGTWIGISIATFIVMPFGRWARLVFLDAAHGNPGPLRQGVVSAVTILVTCFAASALTLLWRESGGLVRGWPLFVAIAGVILTRVLWFCALKRHHARSDLAT